MARHAPKEFFRTERLEGEVVKARANHLLAVGSISGSGYGGDLHLGSAFQTANPPRRLRAAHLRHSYIHPDKIRAPLLEHLDAERSILRDPHREAGAGEHLP